MMMMASHLLATLALLLFISANSIHGTASASSAAATDVGSDTHPNVDGQFAIVAAANNRVDCVDDGEMHVNKLFLRHHTSKAGKSAKKKSSKSSKSRRGKSVKKCPPTDVDMTASPSEGEESAVASTAPPTGAPPPPAITVTPGPTSAFIEPTLAPLASKVDASTPIPNTQTPSRSPSFIRLDSLKLVADDGAAGDRFGWSVAVFGDTLVVGAYGDDDNGGDSGSAYIYNRDPTTEEWILQKKLVADDGAVRDSFGYSVAIFGDTVVVGAYGDDDMGFESGSAYIYNRDPTTEEWILQQKLVPDDGAADDYFGSIVAIHGDTVVVGASGDDDKGFGSGSAYIYIREPTTKEWILQQKLVPDDGAAGDYFGSSVAIHGDTVVVGAHRDDDRGFESGSAYIYHKDSEIKEWILQKKLVPDDGAADDEFGYSVAIHGDNVVVGAHRDDDKGSGSGSVYTHNREPTTKEWILQQKLVPDDGAASDSFGVSVAIHGDTVVVGALADDDKGSGSGSAYIYLQDPESKELILQQKLVPDGGAAFDYFGYSVAIHGDTVVVGARGDGDKGSRSGSVYVYS